MHSGRSFGQKTHRPRAAGQIMVVVAVSLIALIGCGAIATDVGLLWTFKRQMQQAADAAAIAGDREIYSGNASATEPTNAQNAALADVTQNGFTNAQLWTQTQNPCVGSAGQTCVVVNAPPQSGSYANDHSAVEVIVSQPEPTFFLKIFNISSVTVTARAVARYSAAQGCLYALDATAPNAVVASGGSLFSTQCNVYVDSDNTQGLVSSGGSSITAQNSTINVVASAYSGSGFSPTPITNASPVSDPFASMPAPTFSNTCACTNYTVSKNQVACNGNTINATGTSATLNPGVYCGGITVSGNGVSATFTSGTYILLGGGLNVKGGANATGSGVMFYNTYSTTPNYAYAPIVISASSTTLSAPTSGTYEGILFFQDRNIPTKDTGPSGPQNTVSGTSSTSFTGALYFPSTPLVYSGGSATTDCTELIADTLTISGTSYINNDCALFGSFGPPVKTPVLAE